MERVDVAIVGGGPAGTSAAHAAAEHGADALVLEKGVPREDREGLGPDSTDAAGILDYWVDIMGIHPDEMPDGVVQNVLDRAEFRGPNTACNLRSTGIESSYDEFGYTFHRARFDDFLRSRAEDAGAHYRVEASVIEVDADRDGHPRHRLVLASGEEIGADHLLLCDGPQRTVTMNVLDELLPAHRAASQVLSPPTANHIAYQEYRKFPEEIYEQVQDAIVFWWGLMPGHTAYPWIFPNQDRVCRVGLTMPIGMDIDAVEDRDSYQLLRPEDDRIPQGATYIERLLEREYGDEYDLSDFPIVEDAGKSRGTETYPISSTRPIDSPVDAGVAVCGGAMGTTSAFHEGGDHLAVRTGAIAGRLAAQGRLSHYNHEWHEAVGEELLRNVSLSELVRGWKPEKWDSVFQVGEAMLAEEGANEMLSWSPRAGLRGAKLLGEYKLTKFRNRNRYVQLTADEYSY
ncbi:MULTISPECIES: NAD(P)/FAD-dependent oxidoreductase [Halolamina]|uniref:Electron-transferring-flavoprotein dehydrogenase n=1 Tax=Halolamina pelagica TaxID=699431 RepID=A0A1I5V4F3_9EURY|nr:MULTISPECIES: NAD(P)/FAD-dependent oxidoreductase [Halolamina]NHX37891.1 NAD(P)/FAD-dependent oxidoreductase [Halolamina sp. R1-12]SFQ02444.1 electron-transferring-flavoprotein dehydrogenase [Halolamina pelagica]